MATYGRFRTSQEPDRWVSPTTRNTNGETYLARHQTDFKTNWNPTSKLSTFVRFGWGNNYWTTPTQFGVLGGPGLSQTNTAQGYGGTSVYSGTVSGTYIISPSLIFDAHYGYDVNSAFSVQPARIKTWAVQLCKFRA